MSGCSHLVEHQDIYVNIIQLMVKQEVKENIKLKNFNLNNFKISSLDLKKPLIFIRGVFFYSVNCPKKEDSKNKN